MRSGGCRDIAALSPDFFLAFSPQRGDAGNPQFTTAHIPKVVGAVNAKSAMTAQALYQNVFERTERVSGSRVAEMTKLIATDHTACDYDFVVKKSSLVADTRNATSHVTHSREKIVRL